MALIVFSVAVTSLFTENFLWNNLIEGNVVEDKTSIDINPYIQEHKDKTYVFYGKALLTFYMKHEDALYVPHVPDNTVGFVGWVVGSTYYLDQVVEHSIPHMYKDMIDNDNVSFVLEDSKKELVELFYNEHYTGEHEKIALEIEEEFQGYSIYNVIRISE